MFWCCFTESYLKGNAVLKRHPFINTLRAIIKFFTPKQQVLLDENIADGPCVFVCNHARAMGPIAMCIQFPLAKQLHPWIIGQMLKAKEVPAYVRGDYWWKQGRWYTKLCDYTLPYPIALILPPILRGTEPVPVYHDMRVINTFKRSVSLLSEGESLVIFPEKPEGYGDYSKELNTGFLYIAKNYYKQTGKKLRFYPTFIDEKKRVTHVYRSIQYNPDININDPSNDLIKEISKHIIKEL